MYPVFLQGSFLVSLMSITTLPLSMVITKLKVLYLLAGYHCQHPQPMYTSEYMETAPVETTPLMMAGQHHPRYH